MRLLNSWFNVDKRDPCSYKFVVEDITEINQPNLADPDDPILDGFANSLLTAHADPVMIREECNILLEDLDNLNLYIIKKYIEEQVLPVPASGIKGVARIGNFGEILSSYLLMTFQGFSLPIYKLRYREKQSWAMKLTDLCLINRDESLSKPLVCYGEVKTKSAKNCDTNIGIEGHDSLIKDDALEDPEILKFFCTILYSSQQYEEADFFSRLRLGKIEYEKQYNLFLVHEKTTWRDEILDKLDAHPLDGRLANFCVSVVLIQQLREVIDESYTRAWKGVEAILNG
ncbi:MAG: hypothetical protein ACK5CA_06705 [Cyanobacteriota bacterium]|jgi:hypothetical protein